MTVAAAGHVTQPVRVIVHPLWLRVTHWINAVAVIVMIGSGWKIYNASPLFASRFRRASPSAAGSPARCCGTSRRCGCSPSTNSSISCSASPPDVFDASCCRCAPATSSPTPGGAERPALPRRSLGLQRAAEAALSRRHRGRRRDRAVRAGDVEAGAALVARRGVRRLRARALRALLGDGGDRRIFRSCTS